MNKLFVLFFSLPIILAGCVNTHPYKYAMASGITSASKSTSNWLIASLDNGTGLPMSNENQAKLTKEIYNFLKNEGFNISFLNSNGLSSNLINCNNCLVIRPKIIESVVVISNNMAGWHGASEDPLSFWSHFGGKGSPMQFIEGSVPALSLYIEIYSGDKKYYRNAGGIELVGKYNRFSGRITYKDEMVADLEKYQKAITIAFMPLVTALKH